MGFARRCRAATRSRFWCEQSGVSLAPEKAIPLELIINEAVTNACKHAFPGDRCGTIHVSLDVADSLLRLVVRDDGVGLAAQPRDGSLGLRLIRSFARQLRADLEIMSDAGTIVSLSVPLSRKTA